MKTKVFKEEYRGHKLFTVWEVDEKGEKVEKRPIVSLGRKKSDAIYKHLDEFNNFIKGDE